MKWSGRWKITALLTGVVSLIFIRIVREFKSLFGNANPTLLSFIVLVSALVVVIVSGLDRLVWQILRFSLAKREPVIEFQHPFFGKIIREMGLWTGKISLANKSIPFSTDGPPTQPSERLLLQLQGISDNFSQIEAETLNFARSKEPTLTNAKLVPYSIEILHEEQPDSFTLELIADNDDSIVWRVDFINGKPQHIGFDD